MKKNQALMPKSVIIGLLLLGGGVFITGCSQSINAPKTPAQIKSDMGGHYSPAAMAQAKAFQEKNAKEYQQMMQSHGQATGKTNP